MDMTRVLKLWILGWLSVCVPMLVLLFALDLDVSRSPAWQVGLFYLLFIPFTLMWGAWALYLFRPSIPGWRRHALVLGVSALVLVPALGWWAEEGSLGFRTPLLGDLLALFAVASALSVVLYRLIWLSARCAMRGHAGLE
jgi:hypothetical protein